MLSIVVHKPDSVSVLKISLESQLDNGTEQRS